MRTAGHRSGGQRPVSGKILVRAPRTTRIAYGTRIEAAGVLEEPQSSASFDYSDYLAHRGIYSLIFGRSITEVATGAGNSLMHWLLAVRSNAQETIQHLLPQPQAGLLSGILLGDSHAIPKDLQQDFKDSGMTHIIAISGLIQH